MSSVMYVLPRRSVPTKMAETKPSDLRDRSSKRTFLSPLSWSTGSLPPSSVIESSEDEVRHAFASALSPDVSTASLPLV